MPASGATSSFAARPTNDGVHSITLLGLSEQRPDWAAKTPSSTGLRGKPDYHVENPGGGQPDLGSLVQRFGRRVVSELLDGGDNPAPGGGAVVITLSREFVGARRGFRERLLAVALEHELCRAPNVDLGYHGQRVRSRGRQRLKGLVLTDGQ
jgi:hypothetical protein